MSIVRLFLYISLFCIQLSCNSQNKTINQGVVTYKKRYVDKQTNSVSTHPYERDRKVWFHDSLIIGEGSHVNIETDQNGKETIETFVGEYTFIDLRNRSFYEYENFSDTARIIDKYLQPDSGRNKRGWDFFNKESIFNLETSEELSDTTIGQVKYKRIKSHQIVEITNPEEQKHFGKEQIQIRIGYLNCGLVSVLFSMDKTLLKKYGCPVVRLDMVSPSNNIIVIVEREIVSDKLTNDELNVFKAWKKNALENPVR